MGKSSSVIMGWKYLVAYFHGLCAHPIDKFLEFRAANKTAWSGALTASGTITINAPNLFGGDKDQGGIVGDVDVMFGEDGQQPNAYLLSAFGSQVPGWQGFTTLVFKGGEFGAMNPYPQKPAYKILATKAGWDNGCWYPEKCEVPVAAGTTLASDADGWEYQVLPQEVDPGYNNLAVPVDGWSADGQAPFGAGPADGPINTDWPNQTVLWIRRTVTMRASSQTLKVTAENGCLVFINGALAGAVNRDNTQIVHNEDNTFAFPLSAGQTYEIAIKAFDEAEIGTGDVTYLTVEISEPGLTAINPAHVLYEARTAPDRGDEPTANMADASWRAAADWFYAQGFGLCQVEYNADSESVEDFIGRIATMCGCSVSRDPVDGLWYIDVANGVYDLDSLPILTDDDVLEFQDSPSVPDDAINSVAVEYFDPQQWTTVTTRPASALALISANGLNHQTNVYHEIPTADLANRLALRDLANFITPSHAMPITTTRKSHAWRRYTYFRLQLPKRGIADMVCLLAEKSAGTLKSGAIKITAGQDIYGLAGAAFMDSEPGVDTRPPQIPLGIVQQAAFEAPYIDIVRNLSRADLAALPNDVGYLMTVATDPNVSRDYSVTVSTDDGATYADTGMHGQWCPSALIVEGDTLTDAAPATAFTLSGGTLLAGVAAGSAALWDGEIVRVDALDTSVTPNTLTLGRGCADSVPLPHAANSRIWFYDGFAGKDTAEYTDGETVDVKLLTNTGTQQLDPSLATPLALTFAERQVRPYPPAGIAINGNPISANAIAIVGNISLSWAHRDRVGQADQLVDYSAASVGPEAGVTYTVRYYDDAGTLLDTVSGLTGTHTEYLPAAGDGTYRFQLESVRAGITSLHTYDQVVTLTGADATLTLTGSYAGATVGSAYSSDLAIAGGDGTYSNARVTSGARPDGLELSIVGSALRLSGVPTTIGSNDFTVAVDSGDGQTASSAQSVTVSSAFWTPANLAAAPAVWTTDTTEVVDDGSGAALEWHGTDDSGGYFSAGSPTAPTIIAAGQNGRRVLVFDGATDVMRGGAIIGSIMQNLASASIFVAGNPSKTTTTKRLLVFSVSSNGNTRAGITIGQVSNSVTAAQRRLDNDSVAIASMPMPDSGFHVYQSEHDWIGQAVSVRMDGGTAITTNTAQGSGNTSDTTSSEVDLFGSLSTPGQFATGGCGEVLVLQYIPTVADRQKIEGYLAYRWGLQANLPADHPYKTNPPTV